MDNEVFIEECKRIAKDTFTDTKGREIIIKEYGEIIVEIEKVKRYGTLLESLTFFCVTGLVIHRKSNREEDDSAEVSEVNRYNSEMLSQTPYEWARVPLWTRLEVAKGSGEWVVLKRLAG